MKYSVICGTNSFLIDEKISTMFVKPNLEINKFEGLGLSKNDILNSASVSSMFSSAKIIVVHGLLSEILPVEKNSVWKNIFSELDSLISPNEIIFIEKFNEESDLASFKKNKQIINMGSSITTINIPKGRGSSKEILDWISEREKKLNLNLTYEQKRIIQSESNRSYSVIDSELKKLALFSNGKSISHKDFEKLISFSKQYKIFDLLDCFFSNNKSKVITIANNLFENGTSVGEIIYLMSSELHKLLAIRSLMDQNYLKDDEISLKTGIANNYYLKKMIERARSLDLYRLIAIQEGLYNFDIKSKTQSFDDVIEFELFLVCI